MISLLKGKYDATWLASLDAKEVSEKWLRTLDIEVSSSFRNLADTNYWQCPITGFCWYTPVEAVGGDPHAAYYASWAINGYLRNIFSPLLDKFLRLTIHRYSTLPLQWLPHVGLKGYLPGHTLLVELEYLPS